MARGVASKRMPALPRWQSPTISHKLTRVRGGAAADLVEHHEGAARALRGHHLIREVGSVGSVGSVETVIGTVGVVAVSVTGVVAVVMMGIMGGVGVLVTVSLDTVTV